MDNFRFKVWLESIETDRVVMSNGELLVRLEVQDTGGAPGKLPEVFRQSRITDNFEVEFNLIDEKTAGE